MKRLEYTLDELFNTPPFFFPIKLTVGLCYTSNYCYELNTSFLVYYSYLGRSILANVAFKKKGDPIIIFDVIFFQTIFD